MPSDEVRSFWETFYRDRQHVWSGAPNGALVRYVGPLTPGTALDLGCGEGADAVWLAQHGWQVTAVDVSRTALERAAIRAAEAGVAERIDWQQRDLAVSMPSDRFDLVSAQYLHSPVDLARTDILRRAASAVVPGGRLLVVGHAGMPHDPTQYPSAHELVTSVDLGPPWNVEVLEELPRSVTAPDGRQGYIADAVVMFRR